MKAVWKRLASMTFATGLVASCTGSSHVSANGEGDAGAQGESDARVAIDTGDGDGGGASDSGSPGVEAGDAAGSMGRDGGTTDSGGASVDACTDGVQDDGETGVDCGGPCTPCVPYSIATPNTSASVQSGCATSGTVSYICPRFMLFSSEMREAAAADEATNGWPPGSFNYGVATLDGAACCACFQIVYGTVQSTGDTFTPPRPLIIQNFNTGGAQNAFDVFMGKGGEGGNTAGCAKLYASYPSIGEPNGGGIRASSIAACGHTTASLESAACVDAVTADCDMIEGQSAYVTQTTQYSCIEANSGDNHYHDNWNVKARQVECPTALTDVTGCKPNPGSNPGPDPTIQTVSEASSWASYGTTTMEDCCKPSCAWPTVANTQAGWQAMYQCDVMGNPMTN